MAELKWRTRGDSTPKGKPKVWFCAHPEDRNVYFERILKEILQRQNCAVYYDDEPETPYTTSDFFAVLEQMNLFVMPVTTRLLTTKNRAMDVEFAFAISHHIPVLPLMQEEVADLSERMFSTVTQFCY